MKAEQNALITQVGAQTPAGQLLRHYWQPAALVDEFNPELDPRMAQRPLKAVRLLGQDFVLFRDEEGHWGLLDRDCPHRGADLAFARHEGDGIRCPFHGWKFDAQGRCLETPAEPENSTLCQRVRQRRYPVAERSGILFAWLGPEGSEPPAFPAFDCFTAPASHTFAFKGWLDCNWLQALEVGIDPAHASYLHRYFEDESLETSYGKQFRGASAGSQWPMTKVLREFGRPDIHIHPTDYGMRLVALRHLDADHTHVRVTNQVFPQAFVIPLSADITITQWHVPVDDTHCYWYTIFTGFSEPLNKEQMRQQRLALYTLPDYKPRVGRHNDWGFNPDEQRTETYTGMGQDINVHDQWAVESPGPIQDRTREHLGTSDKGIMAFRRQFLKAIETVQQGGQPPMYLSTEAAAALQGPATVDSIAPAHDWEAHWARVDAQRRHGAPWRTHASGSPEAALVPHNTAASAA